MANAKFYRQTVNHTKDQYSYVSIKDDDNSKLYLDQNVTATGKIGSAYDSSYEGKIVSVSNNHKRGIARIKCVNTGTTLEAEDRLLADPPDGTLTVTISGGPTVDPIDVVYVNDVP